MNPAYEHNGQPCSREAFYAIACDPRRSAAVEACAGAGKTWMLVSRILRALIDGAAPHEILAITFTKKAAGEMRQRLQEWLADFGQAKPAETQAEWADRLRKELIARGVQPAAVGAQAERLQGLYRSVLEQARPVQIRTFHSWFAALLRTAPLQVLDDLNLPSAYELLEDDQDAVAEVWRRYLRTVAVDEVLRADYSALVSAHGRHQAHQALHAALSRRVEFNMAEAAGVLDEAVPPFEAVVPELAGLSQPADSLASESARARWLERAASLGGQSNKTPQKAANAIIDAFDLTDLPARLAALRKAFFVASEDRLTQHLKKFDAAQAAEAELQRLLLAACQYRGRLHQQRLVRLSRCLIDEFAKLKRERGWIDMGDIERAALTMLSDPVLSGWVQERLDARVRHLLIDEFQDTNPLQWQALNSWLSGYAGSGGGNTAPSVFIVGDPKQSIYRFRRADPQVFVAAREFVKNALGGDLLACDHTRRNAPGVLETVNTVMLAAQDAGEFTGYRAHTTESNIQGEIKALPAIPRPTRTGTADADPLFWRDSLNAPRTVLEDTLRTLECRQAAQWIAAQVQAGVALREIMVLARKREPLGILQAELRRIGIACEQPEEQILGELPVVQDVLALVDALISPDHNLSLARALKSPLFGLGDDDLVRMAVAARADAHRGLNWLDLLPHVALDAADGAALHAALTQYQRWLTSLPPHDALQAIYSHGDVLARYAAAAPASERDHQLVELRALLAAALQVGGGRYLTAYQLVRALRRQRVAAPRQANPDAVRLLTVHGAKGLEANTVLLLDSQAAPPRAKSMGVLIEWPGESPAPHQFIFVESEKEMPPSAFDLASTDRFDAAREELNALYVAMTRARERLVLSSVTPHTQPANSWWQRIEKLAQAEEAPSAEYSDELVEQASFELLEVPPLAGLQALPGGGDVVVATIAPEPEASEASRLGQAMHWLLEHAADTPLGWRPERVGQAIQRFDVSAEQVARAEALARRILEGEGAWAWNTDHVMEHFNEVELLHEGQLLRMDRLVRRRAGPHGPQAWWVLDYKSAARPENDPLLLAQLARYRTAVQMVHPEQVVFAAFLSADGRMVVAADA
ncbi:UvrD-helicase domain-containing protein [Ottowia thiooxydans]|uniref:UvrD-helicase domain-containing protein n=1 Tax=Ottowia thiooxydans TaxID=219182 RepID=UPI000427292A|nr:UvrD-helicase domain-containing protein [Ottowia thiooxydans]